MALKKSVKESVSGGSIVVYAWIMEFGHLIVEEGTSERGQAINISFFTLTLTG